MVQKTQNTGTGGYTDTIQQFTVTNNVYTNDGFVARYQGVNWIYRVWNTTTNWKAVLASQGWLTTLPYTHEWYYSKRKYAEWTDYRLKSNPKTGKTWKGRAGALTHNELQPPSDIPSVKTDSQSRALAKARNMAVNLAVAAAEGRKTVEMLWGTAQTLGRAYGAFRKGRFKQAARTLGINKPSKSSANNWLAYQYGWLPLISDAVGLAKTLRDEYSSPKFDFRVVRGSAQQIIAGSFPSKNHTVVNNHGMVHFTDVVSARSGLILEITNRGDQFRASVGLGIGDVLLTAWELVPFSFVFDWFVDVGGYLDNISALSGMSVKTGWTSYVRQRTGYFDPSGDPTSLYTSNALPSFITRRHYVRSAWSGSAPLPRWHGMDGLGLSRVVTSAALFKQLYRHDKVIGLFRPKPSQEG